MKNCEEPAVAECPGDLDDVLSLSDYEELALQAAWHLAMVAVCHIRALRPEDDDELRAWILDSLAHQAAPFAKEVIDHLAAIEAMHRSGKCRGTGAGGREDLAA